MTPALEFDSVDEFSLGEMQDTKLWRKHAGMAWTGNPLIPLGFAIKPSNCPLRITIWRWTIFTYNAQVSIYIFTCNNKETQACTAWNSNAQKIILNLPLLIVNITPSASVICLRDHACNLKHLASKYVIGQLDKPITIKTAFKWTSHKLQNNHVSLKPKF